MYLTVIATIIALSVYVYLIAKVYKKQYKNEN